MGRVQGAVEAHVSAGAPAPLQRLPCDEACDEAQLLVDNPQPSSLARRYEVDGPAASWAPLAAPASLPPVSTPPTFERHTSESATGKGTGAFKFGDEAPDGDGAPGVGGEYGRRGEGRATT